MPRIRLSFLLLLLVVSAGSQIAAASDHSPATVIIEGNVAPALQDATFVSHSDPNKVLTVVVGLKLHNDAEFTDLLNRLYDADSLDYHRWIIPTDFLTRFSPSQSDVEAVPSIWSLTG
jgi:subtilase family serine protease